MNIIETYYIYCSDFSPHTAQQCSILFVSGLAFVGTICLADGVSSSIVEDDGDYQSEAVAAHELGHRWRW